VPYSEEYPIGSKVRVSSRGALEDFRARWKLHHPLSADQLDYAGRATTVAAVGFYHGGDVLYTLAGVPGIWHEQCIEKSAD